MKKTISSTLSILAFIFAMCFILVGCGGKGFVPTKADMSIVFEKTANILEPQETPQVVQLSVDDYIDVGQDMEIIRVARMNKLVSLICQNEDFELTSKAFEYEIHNVAMAGDVGYVKAKIWYEDGLYRQEMILDFDGLETGTYYEYLYAEVDYDRDNEVVKSFATKDYLTFDSSYNECKYDGEKVQRLNPESELYQTSKAATVSKATEFATCDYQSTDYDFSEEYHIVMAMN